jgi:transcriptional regulator of acetoin/glycerol metabolism
MSLQSIALLAEHTLDTQHTDCIQQSHERCQTLGLQRGDRIDFPTLGRADLAVARERNQRLCGHAAPVMETLFEQTLRAQGMVVLTDAQGTILHTIGPDAFLQRVARVALNPGVNWSESTKGTNAIGTALVAELPTLVHGQEHFINANHFLTCAAAPILDPRGNILGVLDVTGDQHHAHPYTLGLVKMAVRMIENHWFSDDHRNGGYIHLHQRPEFLGTLTEGILAVSLEGKVLGANRGAQEQLGLSSAALRMHTVTSLFGTSMGALAERFRSSLAGPMRVETGAGQQMHLRARFHWPVWHSLSEVAADVVEATPSVPAVTTPMSPSRSVDVADSSPGAPPPTWASSRAQRGTSLPGHTARGKLPTGLRALATGDARLGELLDKLSRVVDRDIPILIQGETGTGKELLARALHQESRRANQPFIAVNCASIPETLIESELFGYEEGAFTGARRKGAVGKMVQAHGGTLFLDEIGDMPLSLQAHLLRVLQEREVTPLGSARAIPIDINLVCATHRKLREMVERKAFREDLYFRLNGLVVRMPPLRERSDLAALVERILQRESPGAPHALSDDVMALFRACRWQGNVRELAGVLRTACVMAGAERLITREHLSDDFLDDAAMASPVAIPPTPPAATPAQPGVSLVDIELQSIRQAVDAARGNISEAAKQLGISRNTVYRKLHWQNRA